MQVDHKLIEKYHLNQCTPEERNLVEEWLIDDTLDFPSLSISQADKSHIQSEIWENISPHITESPVIKNENLIKKRFRYIAIAASLLIIFGFYISKNNIDKEISYAIFDNSTGPNSKYFDKNNYELILGKHATAKINIETGEFFSLGTMVIIPKKDFEFNFTGTREKKELKNGETYFILNSKNTGKQIILSQSELTFLAPTIQNQLKLQFNNI
ncbi:hypothetical protein [Sphingobacterium faecium]|uniref:hypothetical protein n=1 Tax=Sphingobacterium faecium TaxID=34087 RepID=UPI00320A78BD